MPDRVVKTTLLIDDHGSVKVIRGVGEESERSEKKLHGLGKGAEHAGKAFSGLKGLLAGGVGLLGVGSLAFGLQDIISKTKSVAEETEKFHSITGLGAQSSLKYSQALKARGLNSDNLIKAFGYLAKNVHTAEIQEEKFGKAQIKAVSKGKELTTELGKQAKAIKELGLTAAGFAGKGPEEKIQAITKAFEGLAAGEKKTRLERELFGRGGNQLSILLEKNSLSLNNTAAKVEKYFGAIKGGMHGQEELLEKQREAQLAWEGLQFQLGTKLTPILIKVFEWFSKVTLEVEKGTGKWGELRKVGEKIFEVFKKVWQTFEGLLGPTTALQLAVGGLLTTMAASKLSGIASALAKIGPSAAGSEAGVAGLGAAFSNPAVLGALATWLGVSYGLSKIFPKAHPGAEQARLRQNALEGRNIGGPSGVFNPLTGLGGYTGVSGAGSLRGGLAAGGAAIQGATHAGIGGPNVVREYGAGGHSTVELHMDGHKVAETLLRNPRARREIAEATTIYGHTMAARGHG